MAKDISGKKFGKLTAINFIKSTVDKKYIWLFACECGKMKHANRQSVISGQTRSCGCLRGLKPKEASFNHLYRGYMKGGRDRGLSFELSKAEFKRLTSSDCYYCGNLPTKEHKGTPYLKGFYIYNGVDRKDNNVGYTLDNSVTCCEQCNFAKGTMHYIEFKHWISKVFNNLNKPALKESAE